MSLTLTHKKRFSTLLIEVLLSIVITALFFPHFYQDRLLYRKEIQKLTFCNRFEISLKKHLFFLYDRLYEEPLYSKLCELNLSETQIEDLSVKVGDQFYKTSLIIYKDPEQKDHATLHIRAATLVEDLPYGLKSYQSNYQNYYLKKQTLSKRG